MQGQLSQVLEWEASSHTNGCGGRERLYSATYLNIFQAPSQSVTRSFHDKKIQKNPTLYEFSWHASCHDSSRDPLKGALARSANLHIPPGGLLVLYLFST